MDRALISGALALLILQVTYLMADLGFIEDRIGLFSERQAQNEVIGEILETQRAVKRRAQNSIIWEDPDRITNLHSYDSLLTLSNSSARIQLDGDIQIDIHENTLIVLEPPEKDKKDLIRLRFNRGNLMSQNRSRRLSVGSGEWSIEAQRGSNLSLRSLEDDNVELEVRSGGVSLLSQTAPETSHNIEAGTRLVMKKNELSKKVRVSEELQLQGLNEVRVYSHKFPVNHELTWQGEAKGLRHITPDRKTLHLPIEPEVSQLTLELEPGTHAFSLSNEKISSPTVQVHVLPAPRIRYTSPLPRDRFPVHTDIQFSWIRPEGVEDFRVEWSPQGSSEVIAQEAGKSHRAQRSFHQESKYTWHVVGLDSEGFEIPPHYQLYFYVLEDPLAPPQLQAPLERQPATEKDDPQAFFHQLKEPVYQILKKLNTLIFPRASAEETQIVRSLIFSWFSVPGADFYIIEISRTRGFDDLALSEQVRQTEFRWDQFDEEVYYWRVAGGQDGGRMGLFSEVAEVNLTDVSQLSSSDLAPGVRYDVQYVSPEPLAPQARDEPKSESKPEPKPEEDLQPASTKPTSDEKPKHIEYRFALKPLIHYSQSQHKEDDFKSSYLGLIPLSIEASMEAKLRKKDLIRTRIRYSQWDWEPKDRVELPFQENLSDSSFKGSLLYTHRKARVGYGIQAKEVASLKRKSLEEIELNKVWTYGVVVDYTDTIMKNTVLYTSLAYLNGPKLNGGEVLGSLSRQIYESTYFKLHLGADFEFMFLGGEKSSSSTKSRTGGHIKIEW